MSKRTRKNVEREILADKNGIFSTFFTIKDGKIALAFSSDDELFENTLSGGNMPLMRGQILDSLDNLMLGIKSPLTRVTVNLPNGSAYTEEELAVIIRENIRLHLLMMIIKSRKTRRACLGLMLAGVTLLTLSYFFGEFVPSVVLFDVVNTLGALLIWTTGERMFLEQSGVRQLRRKYADLLIEWPRQK